MAKIFPLALLLACHREPDDRTFAPGPDGGTVPPDTGTPPSDDSTSGDTEEPPIPVPCGTLGSVELVGGPGFDSALDVEQGVDGALYLMGGFGDSIVFDPGGPLETELVSDDGLGVAFVARYAADGSFEWVRTIIGSPDLELAATSDGGVVVSGATFGESTFALGETDAVTLPGSGVNDGVVARFDSGGGLVYAVQVGGNDTGYVGGVGVLADDGVLFSGIFEGRAVFGAGEPGETALEPYPSGGRAGFVARLRPDGTLLWAERFGGPDQTLVGGGAVDPATQELVVAGSFIGPGSAEFPGSAPIAVGPLGQDQRLGYVARWDSDGEIQWVTTFDAVSTDVDLAGDGSALVVGSFHGPAVFGAGEATETTLDTPAAGDVFIARFDTAGGLLWARQSKSPAGYAFTYANGVAASPDGGALVNGNFFGSVTFGSDEPTETSFGQRSAFSDPYTARFDPTGGLGCAVHSYAADGGDTIATNGVLRTDGTWTTTGYVHGQVHFAEGTFLETVLQTELSDGFLAHWTF